MSCLIILLLIAGQTFIFVFCSSQKVSQEYERWVDVKSILDIKCLQQEFIQSCKHMAISYEALLRGMRILFFNMSLSPSVLNLKNAIRLSWPRTLQTVCSTLWSSFRQNVLWQQNHKVPKTINTITEILCLWRDAGTSSYVLEYFYSPSFPNYPQGKVEGYSNLKSKVLLWGPSPDWTN